MMRCKSAYLKTGVKTRDSRPLFFEVKRYFLDKDITLFLLIYRAAKMINTIRDDQIFYI